MKNHRIVAWSIEEEFGTALRPNISILTIIVKATHCIHDFFRVFHFPMKYAQLPIWLSSLWVADTYAADAQKLKFLVGDEGEFDLEKEDGVFASYFDQVNITVQIASVSA